jgi:hypothetical protein
MSGYVMRAGLDLSPQTKTEMEEAPKEVFTTCSWRWKEARNENGDQEKMERASKNAMRCKCKCKFKVFLGGRRSTGLGIATAARM